LTRDSCSNTARGGRGRKNDACRYALVTATLPE
jgi:hypothetical protein